jgi:hypothetical protein
VERFLAVFNEIWIALRVIFVSKLFWIVFSAWFIASFLKLIIHFIQHRKIDFRLLVDTGHMPSSHSAFAASLATGIGMEAGWSSPVFMLALGFAVLVMNDAQGFRRAAGRQAAVLNQIMDDMSEGKEVPPERLREFLGHTPVQVFAGMLIGVGWALLMYLPG